jgi:ADP-heptose:LPS heptosyltransferase/glycosyltransferase involved in cell wall biosynthesis
LADFEAWAPAHDDLFDLITLVHVFEHFYDPVAAIRKLRSIVAEDGRVFIRIPDSDVAGRDQHLTPDHFKIHPFMYCRAALLELLAQTRDCFELESASPMGGAGQSDFVLRPISKAPRIAMGMIAKNEERDLPRALSSLVRALDGAVILDTGSTDSTMQVARDATAPIGGVVEKYLGASERDDAGEWRLQDFSAARNEYLRQLEASGFDWVINLDADDELVGARALRRLMYDASVDAYQFLVRDGGHSWQSHRMWRLRKGIAYQGRCHEYPSHGHCRSAVATHVEVQHNGEPSPNQENANARNLRMLMREWEDGQNTRTAFYIANTHRDAGRFAEAADWYDKRIKLGEGIGLDKDFRDEWLFAQLYRSRMLAAMSRWGEAELAARAGRAIAPDWCEFGMQVARIKYAQKQWASAIDEALRCCNRSVPATTLWREADCYTDQPPRLISWCHEHLGNATQALAWAEIARSKIGKPDKEWDDRIARLCTVVSVQAMTAPRRERRIAIHRPGAIGDVVMSLNLIGPLKAANPGCQVDYFCDKGIGDMLRPLMLAAGVDEVLNCGVLPQGRDEYDRVVDLIGYLQPGYPEKPLERHVLEQFAIELGLPKLAGVGALSLPRPKRPAFATFIGPYVTLQMRAAWSPYKNWPLERWRQVVRALPDIQFCQIGSRDEIYLGEPNTFLCGGDMSDAIAAIANAELHLGVDSFAQHVAHIRWVEEGVGRRVPSVILFGSTQVSGTGYPDNVNLAAGLECQPCFREDPRLSRMPRDPCPFMQRGLHQCMDEITVDDVVAAIRKVWTSVTAPKPEAA